MKSATRYNPRLQDEPIDGEARPCYSCGENMVSSHATKDGPAVVDYDNALPITVTGGYGMFIDPQDESGFLPGFTVVICHDCAHDACEKLPWLEELLQPMSGHSHRVEYKENHPDHFGWDYPKASN